MRKLILLIAGALALILPSAASAATASYQGRNANMTAVFMNISGGGFHRSPMMQNNTPGTKNMNFMFDNVSSVASGTISYPGFGMKFSGTALAPNVSKMLANLQVSGAMRLDGDVTYDPGTGAYTGSGRVVEFTGAAAINTIMTSGHPVMGPGGMMGVSGMMGNVGGMPGSGFGGGTGGTGGWVGSVRQPLGMVNMTVIPSTANIITVTGGTPDRSNPQPVLFRLSMPAFRVTSVQ